ncbi:hypothetical protein [Roseimaritima multifibrata]|nr:hypothetical protein [Roseimaritima multifibrata]
MSVRTAIAFRLFSIACMMLVGEGLVAAQGEPPVIPAERTPVLEESLNTSAFYLLDESGNRVIMPGMTLEELERLKNLDQGYAKPKLPFSYTSVQISGTGEQNHADLEVDMEIKVDASPNGSIGIPLRMGNFHQVAPAEVTGVEDFRIDYEPELYGHVLWIQAETAKQIKVKLQVSAKIDVVSRSSLEFQLPAAPTTVALSVPGKNIVVTTEGRGDEVVRPQEKPDGKTELIVESSGSDFRLNWEPDNETERTGQVLEAQTAWSLRWLSIEDKPTASVDLTVTNLRGDLAPFEIEFASDLRMLEHLGAEIVLVEDKPTENGEAANTAVDRPKRYRVIPNATTTDEVDLQFELEFSADNFDETNPLRIRGLNVIGAVSQSGEVEIRSDEDYRLRWLRRPWVRNLPNSGTADNDPNIYRYSFNRVPFDLPVWLAARQRRLQVDPSFKIRLRQSVAELELDIRISGAATDGRVLPVQMGSWKVQSITTESGDVNVESIADESLEEIDLSSLTGTGNEERGLQIKAVRTIPADENRIELPLPHFISDDDTLLIQPGELDVHTDPGLTLVVDLADSINVDEQPSYIDSEEQSPVLRFDVQTLAPDARLVGFLENDRPRVTLEANANITLEENQLLTVVNWKLQPQRGLSGHVPLAMPADEDWKNWSVTVDDRPAVLRENKEGGIDLVAALQGSETHAVRFTNIREVDAFQALPTTLSIQLPRPAINDLSILGEIPITLRGSATIDIDIDFAGRPMSELRLDALPPRPLVIRLREKSLQQQRIVMSRVMLTTQCGRGSRYERLLATVSGSGNLTIPLKGELPNLTVDLKVDKTPQSAVRSTDGSLVITLPKDQPEHVIDLQIWFGGEVSSLAMQLSPTIQLPIGVGKVYWNVIVPEDQHVVWGSPTMGRAMVWQFDRWRMRRIPIESEAALAEWAADASHEQTTIPNRYLYIGTDAAALRAVSLGRAVIWAIVGSLVLLISTLLVAIRQLRHPLMVVVAAVGICGLTLLAPDAAVLSGQLTLLALALTAVMLGVRAALRTRPHERILDSSRPIPREGSTRSLTASPSGIGTSGSSLTRSLPATANVGEQS